MALAIFDLDNTLLAGDSDHAWGEFLCHHNFVDAESYRATNDHFYEEYCRGELDIMAYQRFALAPLKGRDLEELASWHRQFMDEVIHGIWLPKAEDLLAKHRQQGDFLIIITATNRFITEPIANKLGVDDLIATEPEIVEDRYSGDIVGTPCYQDGKVVRLNEWLKQTGHSLDGSYFYSDSHNDLALLEEVDHPIAVDPDDELKAVAVKKNWQIISLR